MRQKVSENQEAAEQKHLKKRRRKKLLLLLFAAVVEYVGNGAGEGCWRICCWF